MTLFGGSTPQHDTMPEGGDVMSQVVYAEMLRDYDGANDICRTPGETFAWLCVFVNFPLVVEVAA